MRVPLQTRDHRQAVVVEIKLFGDRRRDLMYPIIGSVKNGPNQPWEHTTWTLEGSWVHSDSNQSTDISVTKELEREIDRAYAIAALEGGNYD